MDEEAKGLWGPAQLCLWGCRVFVRLATLCCLVMSRTACLPCRHHSLFTPASSISCLKCPVDVFLVLHPNWWTTCQTVSWSNRFKKLERLLLYSLTEFFFASLLVELFHQLSQALEVLTDAAAKVRPSLRYLALWHIDTLLTHIYKYIWSTFTHKQQLAWCLILFSGCLW